MHDGAPVIELLPARPPQWPNGTVTGLRARGGITVAELAWADGSMTTARLAATVDTAIDVRWQDRNGVTRARQLALTARQHVTVV